MGKLHIEKRYGIAPNDLLNNKNISLKTKGMFVFLQSKPENWRFSTERISKQSKDGIAAVRSALQELEEYGYLKRTPIKKVGKYNGYNYYLFDKPSVDNQRVDNQTAENHEPFSKKENSKQDIVIKSKNIAKQSFAGKEISNVIELFKTVNPSVDTLYGNKTERKVCERLLKKWTFQEIEAVVKILPEINADKFAKGKSIKPSELERNLGYIKSWVDQNNNQNNIVEL